MDEKLLATGIVRRIDDLGRIVIPKELRTTLTLAEGDSLEIYTQGNTIVMKKYQPGCVFCGECEDTTTYGGHLICSACVAKLAVLAK